MSLAYNHSNRVPRDVLASASQMRKALLLIACSLPVSSLAQTMDQKIRAEIGTVSGTVSLFAKNLETGQSYGIRENEPVRTASTIKVPIMVTVFQAVEDGKAKWTDTLEVTKEEKVSGTGVVRELSDNVRLPIRDLLNLMIVVSDNTATNLLLERFTANAVNAEMDRLGFKQTRCLRKILGDGKDLKPTPSGVSDAGKNEANRRFGLGVSTPKEMAGLLEKIERGEVVSAAASKEMIAILKRQQYKDGIGRHVGEMQVASKSGTLDRLRSDSGIVYSPGGRIVISITCEGLPAPDYSEDNPGLLAISRLTGMLVEGLGRKL